jgi:hypothetical protein
MLAGVSLLLAVLLARRAVTRANGLLLLAVRTGCVAVHLWVGSALAPQRCHPGRHAASDLLSGKLRRTRSCLSQDRGAAATR